VCIVTLAMGGGTMTAIGKKRLRERPVLGYGLAVVGFAVALWLRFKIAPALPPGFPYLTFFPAVILTTFLAGLGPGILCAALSGLASWYFFVPPLGSFRVEFQTAVALSFYVFIVTVDIALIHFMVVATDRLKVERQLTSRLYDEQRTMFQELQHRVANNMAFIASLLHLQRRRASESPELKAALDSALARIETMSRLHRRLYDPGGADASLEAHLRGLVGDLVEMSGAANITTEVTADPAEIDVPRLITLSMLVTEVVMNSLKHAFVGRPGGHIAVGLQRRDDDRLELRISDNGRGISGAAPGPGGGLGVRIVENLGSQLQGKVVVENTPNGVTTRLIFLAA